MNDQILGGLSAIVATITNVMTTAIAIGMLIAIVAMLVEDASRE